MQLLKIKRGTWEKGKVNLGWDTITNKNRYIYALDVTQERIQSVTTKDIRDLSPENVHSIAIEPSGRSGGVIIRDYIIVSSSERLDVRSLSLNSLGNRWREYKYSAVIGKAKVRYWVKKRRSAEGTEISFILKSNVDIEKGLLGYKYICGNKEIRLPFPWPITGGNKKIWSKSILVPTGSNVVVCPMDQSHVGSIQCNQGSFLEGVF